MSIPAGMLREHSHKIASKRPREVTPASLRGLQPLAPGALLQRAALAPESLRPAEVLRLQQTLGNRAVGGLLNGPSGQRSIVQAKLTVNAPGDEYEQEADRVADAVMRMPAVQGEEMEEDEEPEVMTKREQIHAADGAFEAGENFEQQLRASRGSGQSLPHDLQAEFETKFGADFSGVRVHADAHADQLNRSLQARAFTTGRDIFFRHGAYDPGSRVGQALIAHELTHVVQQVGEQIQPKEKGKQQKQQLSGGIVRARSIEVHRDGVRSDLIQPKYLDEPQGAIAGLRKLRDDLKVHSEQPYYDSEIVPKLLKALLAWAQEGNDRGLQAGTRCIEAMMTSVKQKLETKELQTGANLRDFLGILRDVRRDITSKSALEEEKRRAPEEKTTAPEEKRSAAEEKRTAPEKRPDVWDGVLSNKLKGEWLQAHNDARTKCDPAIRPLTWDEELAKQAEDLAGTLMEPVRAGSYKDLKLAHEVPGVEGQNLADWGTAKSSPGMGEESKPLTGELIKAMPHTAVRMWAGEEYAYKLVRGPEINAELKVLPKNLPTKPVWGHYTQVVWPQTEKVGGCIAVYRRVLQRQKDGSERLIQLKVVAVCNYYPGGNVQG
jgi:hypothetical protein